MVNKCSFLLQKVPPQIILLDIQKAVLITCHFFPRKFQKQTPPKVWKQRKIFRLHKKSFPPNRVLLDAYNQGSTIGPKFLVEGPKNLAQCPTTGEKSELFIFIYFFLRTHGKQFFRTVTKKFNIISKIVAENTKMTKLCIFFRKILILHRVTLHTWKAVLTTLLKDFRQVTEDFRPKTKMYMMVFSYKKRLLKVFIWTRTMQF